MAPCDRPQFRAGLFQRRAGGQPAEQLGHAMAPGPSPWSPKDDGTGHDVGDDLGLGRIRHGWLQNPHHGGRARIRTIPAAPFCPAPRDRSSSAVDQKRYVRTTAPAAFGPSSRASSSRPSTGCRPITSKYDAADNAGAGPRAARRVPIIGKANRGEIAERAQRFHALPQIVRSPARKTGVVHAHALARSAGCRSAGLRRDSPAGRSNTPRTRVKMAALAPIPSASVSTTVTVSPLRAPANGPRISGRAGTLRGAPSCRFSFTGLRHVSCLL